MKNEEALFDDLEELMEESKPTFTAKDVKDLDDLDGLLEESIAIADAKKKKAKGSKLTAADTEILDAVEAAIAAAQWKTQRYVAHVVRMSCECGHHWLEFAGWYAYQEQRGGTGQGKRLLKVVKPEDATLPCGMYESEQVVHQCVLCLSPKLPEVTVKELGILETLNTNHRE